MIVTTINFNKWEKDLYLLSTQYKNPLQVGCRCEYEWQNFKFSKGTGISKGKLGT